jgi:hypothetical protein
MENLIRALVLLPLEVAIVEGIKKIIPKTFYKFLWLSNCALGVGLTYAYVSAMNIADMNNAMIILG